MSDPSAAHTLTAARLAVLRLIATGATRNRDGSPFRLHPTMLAWFLREGYVDEPAPRPPTDAPIYGGKRRSARLTAKGWVAVGGDPRWASN